MSFDERMKEINSWAIPLEGTPERKWLDKRLAIEREQNPEIQKKSDQPLKLHKHLFTRNKTMEQVYHLTKRNENTTTNTTIEFLNTH